MTWIIWCKALGVKAFEDDKQADKVAMIRTTILIIEMVTCFFIIAGNVNNLFF